TRRNPAIEIIAARQLSDADGIFVAGVQRKRLALGYFCSALVLAQYGNTTLGDADRAGIVKILKPKLGAAFGFHRKIAAGYAEVVAIGGGDVKRRRALTQDQSRGLRAIGIRQIEELNDRVFAQE